MDLKKQKIKLLGHVIFKWKDKTGLINKGAIEN